MSRLSFLEQQLVDEVIGSIGSLANLVKNRGGAEKLAAAIVDGLNDEESAWLLELAARLPRNAEPRLLVWDYRQQPDLDQLAAAVAAASGGTCRITVVDTVGDEYALVVGPRVLAPDEAYAVYERGGS